MTLLELCEPLFQYVARLKRLARMNRSLEMSQVRSDIKRLFADMRAGASSIEGSSRQYEDVELPLLFFVDFMVKESNLSFSADWAELGRERNELAGDEKFFDLLDETLTDASDEASQRLAVYYTCLGLGFTGIYAGQQDSIRRFMTQIAPRISDIMDPDETSPICPEAYENVDARDFVEPAGENLGRIGIVLVGLLVLWCIASLFLFRDASEVVDDAINTITENKSTSDNHSTEESIE